MKQLSCFVLLLLVAGVFSKGTLYLNKITGNVDPIDGESPVYVECVVFTDDEIILDFINGLQGDGTGLGAGTTIEGSNNNEGNLTIPGNLHVDGQGTVDGFVFANGGIFCDDGEDGFDDDVFDYSFSVWDNTGIVTVVGTIFPNGGIKVGDDLFTVQDDSGRTQILGLTRPDGGIAVQTNLWTVRTDGYLYSKGNISVEHDFYFGSSDQELRFFERFPTTSPAGGDTTFHGQDAATKGGNLVLIPGFGTGEFAFHNRDSISTNPAEFRNNYGAIFLGRPGEALDFNVRRQDIEFDYSYGSYPINGGQTIFSGQDSSNNGGKIYLSAGDGTGSFPGGDIYLTTGYGSTPSSGNGVTTNGNIILGPAGFSPDYGTRLNFDLHVTRPPITDASNAGDTFILGQTGRSTASGGSLIFRAGSGNTGGGDLFLQPGERSKSGVRVADTQGEIYIGTAENRDLLVRRLGTFTGGFSTAGATYFSGQDSLNGEGGSTYFISGGSSGATAGSSIHLIPGTGSSPTNAGIIYWDTQLTDAEIPDELFIVRDPRQTSGTLTTITGQSNGASGGALNIFAGAGRTFGGSLNFFGGKGNGGNGGGVVVSAADGTTSGGGLSITAGAGTNTGGSITFWPGNGNPTSIAADLTFAAGSGATNLGDITFTSGAQLLVKVPFILRQNTATTVFRVGAIGNPSVSLSTFNDPATGGVAFITHSTAPGVPLIKPRRKFTPAVHEPVFIPTEDANSSINEMRTMINEILAGLVYHGLVSTA